MQIGDMGREPKFFVLEWGGFAQYKYAWTEAADNERDGSLFNCPSCGKGLGGLHWQPPYRVELKQARNIGDITYCLAGADFVVTPRVLQVVEAEGLSGFARSYRVEVVLVGKTRTSPDEPGPELWGVDVARSAARADYAASEVKWDTEPEPGYCPFCGPGGGGGGGIWRTIGPPIALEKDTWSGEDIFKPMNFNHVFLSERAADVFRTHGFTNAALVPMDQWQTTFGPEFAQYQDDKMAKWAIRPEQGPVRRGRRQVRPVSSGDHPRIEVAGVYRLHLTPEMFREQLDILYGEPMSSSQRREAERQCRELLEGVVLVEVVVRNPDECFDLADFTQPRIGIPEDRWQVPWAEAYLSVDGDSLAVERWSDPGPAGDLRIAFFMYDWQPDIPLRSSYGEVACPQVQEMPERLARLVPYEPVD